MKWSPNVFLKYLHRLLSEILRFFSAGPRFVSSSTAKSNQSSINASYLNHDVDSSKNCVFVCCDSTSTFTTQQPRSATALWLLVCSFCGSRTQKEFVAVLWVLVQCQLYLVILDRFRQRGQEDMMTTRIESQRDLPFSSLDTQTRSHEVQLTGWSGAKQLSEQNSVNIRTRQERTSGRNDENMVAGHKLTLFSSSWMPLEMSLKVRYSFFTVMRMTARNLVIAIRIVHAVGLSCSTQLMISNQNTHAFSSELHRYANLHMTEKSQQRVPHVVFIIFIGTPTGCTRTST